MTWTLDDRYLLTDRIASGATGEVWEALDRGTGRIVAVKLLHSHLTADPRLADRLLRSRSTLTGLWHPGIARLLDVVVSDGSVGLVSDVVPGTDLGQALARSGPMAPVRAAGIAATLAGALATAHRLGVVHGDVKPSNVLLPSDGGTVKLTDFSVTLLVRVGRPRHESTPAAYSAPEIIDGAVPAPPSDVYALGIVLYQMLAGTARYREAPDRRIDRDLLEIVDRCVLADPGARPSAEALAGQLRDLGSHLAQPPSDTDGRPAAPPPGRERGGQRAAAPAPAPSGSAAAGRSRPAAGRPVRAGPRLARLALSAALAVALVVVTFAAVRLLTAPGQAGSSPRDSTTIAGLPDGGEPPALPAAAATRTQDGGAEFIRFWFAALNHAVQTGDTTALAAVTSPLCADCRTALETIEAVHADGGALRGGGYVVRSVTTASIWSADRPVYDATLDRSPRTTLDRSGTPVAELPALSFANCVLVLEWTGQRWQLTEVTSRGCVG